MRGNAWTTLEEFQYLNALKTRFTAEQDNQSVGSWLSHTASEFLKQFPLHAAQFNRERLKLVRSIILFLLHISNSSIYLYFRSYARGLETTLVTVYGGRTVTTSSTFLERRTGVRSCCSLPRPTRFFTTPKEPPYIKKFTLFTRSIWRVTQQPSLNSVPFLANLPPPRLLLPQPWGMA